ncbi:hypothetical protein A2318_02460 [Candidatus Uhrbacteria bacterium RIFOXYB2_FULL_45_11]|uniref:Uncharacterized protein n=1 Tax=Candidatus Uhrbacteria bacterium RIFOXYB2_FULL_45_11 TaxID=1802421 RepID=A0A1F7W5C7_9BACT|nr:MAG: hypothetical protein A2318_02460 [Candidatus Uhrbacteria bacterium RIFOXYB2_FULL_45_11]
MSQIDVVVFRGDVSFLHREIVSLCGVTFKFYHDADDAEGHPIISARSVEVMAKSRERFFRKTVRGYVRRVVRRHESH